MEQSKPQEKVMCCDCGTKEADPTVIGIYEVCRPCYNIAVKTIQDYKKNRTHTYPEINEILPRLYLGNEDAAINKQIVKKHNISSVLVCGTLLDSPFEQDLIYKKLPIGDDPRQNILELFDGAVDFVHGQISKDKTVLIHCAAGVSRSASFTIAYLMKHKKMNYVDSRSFVKSKRPVIMPNSGFVTQLMKYEQQLQRSNK